MRGDGEKRSDEKLKSSTWTQTADVHWIPINPTINRIIETELSVFKLENSMENICLQDDMTNVSDADGSA